MEYVQWLKSYHMPLLDVAHLGMEKLIHYLSSISPKIQDIV